MKKSFTLIELLVVIGITLLLVFGVVTGLSAGRESREVKTTAERVRAMILEARSRAMNPEEETMGLQRVEIRVGRADNSNPNCSIKPYEVKIVEVYNNSEKDIQDYVPPKNVKVEFEDPGSVIKQQNGCYYYFLFDDTNTLTLGYIFLTVTQDVIIDKVVNMNISDVSDTTKYQLKIHSPVGNVDIEAM